ncbi:MAG: glycosyltransferase [Lachnospiraceae bacterium]|jgi:glycosyltransferase involved in cell wall biosynthesis|nr:glycosyltransferase [Lachnospiraceae bacterium]
MIDIKEETVMENWDYSKYIEPLVAIVCLTYNHELYIRDAIESFLSQKTTFPFEIYIHDDCSTDGTVSIVQEYAEAFPGIIKPIYESENRWKEDYGASYLFHKEITKRKYQAECEGDDYWTDPHKLQRQIDYMEEHEDCSLTVTNGKRLNVLSGSISPVFEENEIEISKRNGKYDLNNFYLLKYPPTASHVYRREFLEGVEKAMSPCRASDFRNRLFLMTKGYVYYFSEETCIYRIDVKGSATSSWKNFDIPQQKDINEEYVRMLCEIDELTKRQYTDSIWKVKKEYISKKLGCGSFSDIFKTTENKKVFHEMSIYFKIRTILKIIMPNWLYVFIYLRDR